MRTLRLYTDNLLAGQPVSAALDVLTRRIEDEAAKNGWTVMSCSFGSARDTLIASVLYEGPDGSSTRPIEPLPPGAKAPTVEAISTDGKRAARVMAGVSGVIEGQKLSPEDTESAPVPLLSPTCDLKRYADLFGNL